MGYKCIIIEDEAHSIDTLKEYIHKAPYLELLDIYTDPIVAMAEIKKGEPVDFIFSDIEMPGIDGLSLAKLIRHKTTHLIFTTGHLRYAIDGYDVQASGFLLKPISFEKFATLVLLLISRVEGIPVKILEGRKQKTILVKNLKRVSIPISINDIVSIEIKKESLSINTIEDSIATNKTLKEAEELLLGTGEFIKIHRSYIIAVKYIKNIEDRMLMMKNDQIIPIGETYRVSFLKAIEEMYKF